MNAAILATEAHKLHAIFEGAFFVMLASFLTLAVVMEMLRIPLGDTPGFSSLLSRTIFAAFLLVALPEIMNFVADATDGIAAEIGSLNNIHLVLSRVSEKLNSLSYSWTSLRDMVTILLSFLSFCGLYITVYFAEAAFLFVWTLIYVFSPLVLALYVFPATSGATKALLRSILEVSLWKIVWAAMAALLWSMALSDINKPDMHVNWLTSIVLNLMLMVSVLATPKVVHAILSGGISELAGSAQGAVMGAASMTPPVALAKAKAGLLFVPGKAAGFARAQGAKAATKGWKKAKAAGGSALKRRSSRSKPFPNPKHSPITPNNHEEVRNAFFAGQDKRRS